MILLCVISKNIIQTEKNLDIKDSVLLHSQEIIRARKSIETKSKLMLLSEPEVGTNEEFLFNGYRLCFRG